MRELARLDSKPALSSRVSLPDPAHEPTSVNARPTETHGPAVHCATVAGMRTGGRAASFDSAMHRQPAARPFFDSLP